MKPTIGRIVHFVQKTSEWNGGRIVHLPAIITAVWSETSVNLHVMTDGSNSEGDGVNFRNTKWKTSVNLDDSETPAAETWHWPERVD